MLNASSSQAQTDLENESKMKLINGVKREWQVPNRITKEVITNARLNQKLLSIKISS